MAVKARFTGARAWATAWQVPIIMGFAAPGVAAAAEEGRQAGALEEVVVTARKREESLQDTPIAISAFSAAALERQQITSTEDLDQVAPNLQFASYGPLTGNNSAAQVYIRGIGQSDGSSGVDPGVGLYIDDVYMGRSVGGVLDFRDISNVQILRGPQGTLFGRNTIGGAVLLTTTLPGKEFGGTARVGFGDDKLYEGFAAVDLPIADTLAARFSVGARQRDGYVTRVYDGVDLGNEDTYTVQSSLQWLPSDDVTFTLRADYTQEDENGSPFVFAAINESQVFPAAISRGSGCPGATFPPPSVPQNTVDPRCANDATWDLGKYRNGGNAPRRVALASGCEQRDRRAISSRWQLIVQHVGRLRRGDLFAAEELLRVGQRGLLRREDVVRGLAGEAIGLSGGHA